MNHPKRIVIALVFSIAAAIMPALILVIYVDPLQIYHKPFLSGLTLQENQRYQNAGLINSYLSDPAEGYDSVMIGTSMSQNFTGAMASPILGWKKTMRLFMPGAVAEEQLAVLRHALDTGRVEHVLLELHPFLYQDSYRQKKQVEADPTLYFPAFLYNDTLLDDAAYLFNIDVLKMAWQVIMGAAPSKKITAETIGYWADRENVDGDHAAFNSPENITKLKEQTSGFFLNKKTETEISALDYPIISESLVPALIEYCDSRVEIVLFVPPWPRFRYQKSEKVTLRSVYMIRRILEKVSHCSNIALYDFDLLDMAGDMNNYSDEQHYLPKVNHELLERISRHENQLTMDNVSEFEDNFINVLNHYLVYTSYSESSLQH